jgi:hypothetical protein
MKKNNFSNLFMLTKLTSVFILYTGQCFLFLISLVLFLFFYPSFVSPVFSQEETDVLFVYRTDDELKQFIEVIHACGKSAIPVSSDEYESGTAAIYPYLITTSNVPVNDAKKAGIKPLCIGDEFSSTDNITIKRMQDVSVMLSYENFSQMSQFEKKISVIADFQGKETVGKISLRMGNEFPFAVFSETEVMVPYVQKNELSMILLGAVMQRYFENPEKGTMYVLIDEIYPFSDLGMLCDTADLLYKNAIPFIARIMPVYDNLDYPAFLRFTQVLRFIQSRNGTIVIHEPIIRDEIEREPLKDKMNRMYAALTEQGINWVGTQYSPFFLQKDMLDSIESSEKTFGFFPIDTMVEISLPETKQELTAIVEKLNQNWLSLSDYKRFFTNENYQYSEIQIDEQYSYLEARETSFLNFFTLGNRFLLLIVSGSLILFVSILIIGFRLYRKKFY